MTIQTSTTTRKTLGITGITIHAMALIAPGAFAWMLYQTQVAGEQNGLGGIWAGVAAALCAALLTAFSFGELAGRYSGKNLRSAYHYAEQVFLESSRSNHNVGFMRIVKVFTSWVAHLYYWVYPGVMVAFIGILTDYLLRQLGYEPKPLGQVILALSFAAFVGFLALRGITGTTPSSIILNTIQLSTLLFFSILAIVFRFSIPLQSTSIDWVNPTLLNVLLPSSIKGMVFQASIAMLLMVGFEAVTSLNTQATNPRKDIPRAGVFALIIQGALSYLLIYFATGLAMNNQIDSIRSTGPIGELAKQVGDQLLGGNGFSLMFVVAFAVMVALLGALLTAVNNGVRISFSMMLDWDMPDPISLLNPNFATPYHTVIVLCLFSALLGVVGILGGLPSLMGLILASNLGAFLLYSILCFLTILTFAGTKEFNWVRHLCLPMLGILLTLSLAIFAPIIALSAGGVIAQGAKFALSLSAVLFLFTIGYFIVRKPEK